MVFWKLYIRARPIVDGVAAKSVHLQKIVVYGRRLSIVCLFFSVPLEGIYLFTYIENTEYKYMKYIYTPYGLTKHVSHHALLARSV